MIPPLSRWVRGLLTAARRPPRPRRSSRPTLERLEDRLTPSVTFAGQVTFAAGAVPHSVAVADLTGDGRLDLVVADESSSAVSVLSDATTAGATSPSFAAPVTFAVGGAPTSVAVGDFNGDGKPDLVITNTADDTVSVLLNTTPTGATAPSFAPQVTFAVGAGPFSVVVGDFNGDGKPDLAIANNGDGTVSVLLNRTPAGATTPSFAPHVTFTVGAIPFSVAAADFNGDGRPDLVVANEGEATVSVLLDTTAVGATAPTFAPQTTFTVGPNPEAVAAADFNGDGRPDLVVANEGGGTVSVLLNTTVDGATAPTFAPQSTFTVGGAPDGVAVGDFNGDGRPDLVVANFGNATASVLLDSTAAGATAPTFAPQVTFAVGNNPISVAAGDFNGDGRTDFVAANESANAAAVLLNTTAPLAVTTPVVVADLHGMGVVEFNRLTGALVQLNPGNPADVSLLTADAQGDVFADYTGYGVYRYVPSVGSWQRVNGTDALAIATDARGDLFASFTGAGIGLYRLDGSAQLLTPMAATLLSSDAAGDLVGEFPGYGVSRRTAFTGVWVTVNGNDAQAVAIDGAGDVFASFNGAGIGEFRVDGTAALVSTSAATRLAADPFGDLTALIPNFGVEEFHPTFSRTLAPTAASLLAMDDDGFSYAEIPGYGLWEFDPLTGWRQISAADVSLLAGA